MTYDQTAVVVLLIACDGLVITILYLLWRIDQYQGYIERMKGEEE